MSKEIIYWEKKINENSLKVIEYHSDLTDISYLNQEEKIFFNSLHSVERKNEYLSIRLLNYQSGLPTIYYLDNKKPYYKSDYNLSIAHTKNISTIYISTNKKIGVDIEVATRNIPIQVLKKTLSSTEQDKFIENTPLIWLWMIKEVLYKIDSTIKSYKEDLIIQEKQESSNIFKCNIANECYFIEIIQYKNYFIAINL